LAPYPLKDGHAGSNNPRNTTKVGFYKWSANRFGLFDMHGNVHEWCQDWYDVDYYRKSPQTDPQGPPTGQERIMRGGCWLSTGKGCRSARRLKLDPNERHYGVGFRVVLEKN
jgi:formylglycine-generating enzyme required for sulfatase activity